MDDNRRFRIVSYNLHRFNQGKILLSSLCASHDFVFVQEHWLALYDLDKLNTVTYNMVCFGSSAMNEVVSRDCLSGRPFGGVAVYVKQCFAASTKLVSSSKRYIILIVGQLLLINVYLPCISTANCEDEYIVCLSSIMNDISELQFPDIIYGVK